LDKANASYSVSWIVVDTIGGTGRALATTTITNAIQAKVLANSDVGNDSLICIILPVTNTRLLMWSGNYWIK